MGTPEIDDHQLRLGAPRASEILPQDRERFPTLRHPATLAIVEVEARPAGREGPGREKAIEVRAHAIEPLPRARGALDRLGPLLASLGPNRLGTLIDLLEHGCRAIADLGGECAPLRQDLIEGAGGVEEVRDRIGFCDRPPGEIVRAELDRGEGILTTGKVEQLDGSVRESETAGDRVGRRPRHFGDERDLFPGECVVTRKGSPLLIGIKATNEISIPESVPVSIR